MSGFSIELSINDKLYLRDPQRSEVGRRILRHSILLMDEIGLESFTFKKLAEHADTTEATIYRYFESKHLLLLYLINWYWAWTAVQIDMAVQNIEDAEDRLRRAIKAVISASRRNLSDHNLAPIQIVRRVRIPFYTVNPFQHRWHFPW